MQSSHEGLDQTYAEDQEASGEGSGYQNAMFLLSGKPEQGTTEQPQSGYYLSEDQNLDESFETQITQVYKYLNSIVVVANQHGAIINQMLRRERDQTKGNDIVKGLERIGKHVEVKNNTLHDIMSS